MTEGFVCEPEGANLAILAFQTMLLKQYVLRLASVIIGRLTAEEAINQASKQEE